MQVVRGTQAALEKIRTRSEAAGAADVDAAVAEIVAAVRADGDAAVRELTARHDGVRPASLTVPAEALATAGEALPADLREAVDLAIARVERFHRRQSTVGFLDTDAEGSVLGQLVRPLDRVGVYVPGGSAPLFSSLVMTAVPARVAGVGTLVAATPPRADGSVAPEILYAAHRVGIDTVVTAGGAQAIAALAFGTESVPRVDKVVGPGNRFVVAAKRQVYGHVGIESLPGPTETMVLADDEADARHVVADLLAQAEHEGAQPVLVTLSARLAEAVQAALGDALADLPTAATAAASLEERGWIAVVEDLTGAVQVANAFAPEHLCLLVAQPWDLLGQVRHAGGVFVGAHSMEALGDYLAGPSHVMPTGGTARFASAVNVRDFQKVIPVLGLSAEAVRRSGPAGARMARAEGMEAHARAIEARRTDD